MGLSFTLPDTFINSYASTKPDFGFKSGPNSLGELTFFRTYSRLKEDGKNEQWYETVRRVVEGTYEIQRRHCVKEGRPWNESKALESAMEMYDRIFTFKFLPPGRGLWMMGTDYVMNRDNGAPLQNCAFISTKKVEGQSPSYPFTFLMDFSMLGVGVGFDTRGAGTKVYDPTKEEGFNKYQIADSREGWVESVKVLLDSYFYEGRPEVFFDYDLIRKKGELIKGFGGTASGPEPLVKLHERIREVMRRCLGQGFIDSRAIVDIQNMIGACVVAGNVRRSAELALGEIDDEDFINLKNYKKNPERGEWGWASNNSLIIRENQEVDYDAIAQRIADNGEPGIFYIDAARMFGRMNGEPDYKDMLVEGANPCAEQMLESGELCNLVEVFPTRCDGIVDFLRTLKFAYLYSKTVTLIPTHDEKTNEIMARNRRIGTSVSGVVQFLHDHDEAVLEQWLEAGYGYIDNLDNKYSNWFGINRSVRRTTVKPSGTVSLLAGATPGVHFPVADYYIRRIRLTDSHPLIPAIIAAGYHVEADVVSDNTVVVEMPIKGEGLKTETEVSVYDKADVAAFMARHWSDNAVSVTLSFREDEKGDIADVLRAYKDKWKTVSFLPITDHNYAQAPYEAITPEEYEELVVGLTPIDLSNYYGSDGEMEKFCTTDKCETPLNFDDIDESEAPDWVKNVGGEINLLQ